MDQVIGKIREGFTFLIELKTLQIHADRAMALPDRGYNGTTSTLRAHYRTFSAFGGRVNAIRILEGWVIGHKGSISKHYLLQCCWFVSRQLHGSPMLTKFIIMVNKTPRDRIASPTYSPPHKLKFMSLTRVTATDQELKEDRKI